MTAGLRIRDLVVVRDGVAVVDGVSLAVGPGEVVGLVGPNGAGKSSLVAAVVGHLPSHGTVHVDGRPVAEDRRLLAWVPQSATPDPLFPAVVEEVVWMGRYPHLGALRRRTDADGAAVADAMAQTGTTALAGRPVAALSGGQQRRVAIARALAQQARCVVLDEPYAGLDRPTEEDLRDLVRRLADGGTAVLVVDHDLAEVATGCDRVVLLHRTVQAAGPPQEVLRADVVAAAYGGRR